MSSNKSKESVTTAFNEWRLYSSITQYQTRILYPLIVLRSISSCLFVTVDSFIWKVVIETNYEVMSTCIIFFFERNKNRGLTYCIFFSSNEHVSPRTVKLTQFEYLFHHIVSPHTLSCTHPWSVFQHHHVYIRWTPKNNLDIVTWTIRTKYLPYW